MGPSLPCLGHASAGYSGTLLTMPWSCQCRAQWDPPYHALVMPVQGTVGPSLPCLGHASAGYSGTVLTMPWSYQCRVQWDPPYQALVMPVQGTVGPSLPCLGHTSAGHSGTLLTMPWSLEIEHLKNAERINMAILQKWLQGKGLKPVTWSTLVTALERIN